MTAKEKYHLDLLRKVKEAREAKGYSQTYVAEKIGTSQVHYSRIESGINKIPLETFVLIARVLDLDFDLMPNKEKQKEIYFTEFVERVKGLFKDEKQSPQTL